MYNKITKYLNSKDENYYTNLDIIFQRLVNGTLKNLLDEYGFSQIEIFTKIQDGNNELRLNFVYFNLHVTIGFYDSNYEYCLYDVNASAESLDKSFKCVEYSEDFSFENCVDKIYNQLCNSDKLVKNFKNKFSKSKLFKILKILSIIIPCIIVGVLGLCVYINKEPIKTGFWGLGLIFFFIVIYMVIDYLSYRK